MHSHLLTICLFVVTLCLAVGSTWLLDAPLAAAPLTETQVNITLVPIASGLTRPLALTHAGDGSDRIFVAEKGGTIRILQPGAGPHPVFLNISTLVSTGNEQGLLGLAFHPNYDGVTNRYFYVNYTNTSGHTVIARYSTQVGNPNVADPNSALTILSISQPYPNHNGGDIRFGPDGYLYISSGDGGSGNDPQNNGQRLDTLLGKILRIDVDNPSGGNNYGIPPGNPYLETPVDDPNTRAEIWHWGLRNPWRFSFDRVTNDMWIGDVGQGAIEEIDFVANNAPNVNFGWRIYEGTQCTSNQPAPTCVPSQYTMPVQQYSHTGGRCSVTGGFAYRGPAGVFPAGTYLYGEYCTGEIWRYLGGTNTLLVDTPYNISSFGEDEAGELYVLHLTSNPASNSVFRFQDTDATATRIATAAVSPTRTRTPTVTRTATPTATRTATATSTRTATPTPVGQSTATRTPTVTVTLFLPTLTRTATRTTTPTATTQAAPGAGINPALQKVAEDLSEPLGLVSPGDGSRRLMIVEKGGVIKVLQNGAVLPTPFLNISTLVSTGLEQGLLGLAFHPNYDGVNNRFFYINYTDLSGNTMIARYMTQVGNPNVADPTSALPILTINQPAANHNGGALQFGPDGYLYIGTGDGGSGAAANGQSLNTLLGKVLRIDVNTPSGGNNYGIPPGNPYLETPADNPNTRAEIWHWGLRNPWRVTFDRQTGEMFMGDVGEASYEEIDYAPAGTSNRNYGWATCEGAHVFPPTPPPGAPCTTAGLTNPILEYGHSLGQSITGGYRYRGARFPAFQGLYFYADFITGRLWAAHLTGQTWANVKEVLTGLNISAFGEDEDGEVYVVHFGGAIYRLINRHADTPGVYRPNGGSVFLRNNSNTAGPADIVFAYGGVAGDVPLAGDWNGDGSKTIGVFRNGVFYLRNSNSNGPADLVFAYGLGTDLPVVGDWNGDGVDTVGVYRNGVFYLRDSNTGGPADLVFGFGVNGDTPVTGDWNGDGIDTIGVFRNGVFYLRNANNSGPTDVVFGYGLAGDIPLAGDWDADGDDSIGVFRNGVFYLRTTNNSGPADLAFAYGLSSDRPIVGDWDGLP